MKIPAIIAVTGLSLGSLHAQVEVVPGEYDYYPPVSYQAPVIYEAPVVYQAPVVYHAPVYYIETQEYRRYEPDYCPPRPTVIYIGGPSRALNHYEQPCYDSTVIPFGRGQAYQHGYHFRRWH